MSIELNFIEISEDVKRLYNFPNTDEDIVFKTKAGRYHVGYYDSDPDDQGFCSDNGWYECDSVLWWIYCKELE